MVYICAPERVEIFDNSALRLTAAQVKARTGCDVLINGGYFSGTLKPYGNIKANGKWLHMEPWDCPGYVWDEGELPTPALTLNSGADNVFSCLWAVTDGRMEALDNADSQIGGRRGRSGFGFTPRGEMVLLCTSDAAEPLYLTEAVDMLKEAGCEDAVLCDGGGSCQMICPSGTVTSSRIVSNYICVWERKENEKGDDNMSGKKYRVALDPGHGAKELNQSPDGRYLEYKFAWDLAGRIKELLESLECFEVYCTKDNEAETPTLSGRAAEANAWGADIFVSLHSNAVAGGWNDSVHGTTVWIYAPGGQRQVLAEKLLEQYRELGVELYGSELYTARFAVLARTNMPAVLIEHYFHTCRGDVDKLLDDGERDTLALAAARGICEYFNVDGHLLELDDSEAEANILYRVQVGAFADESNAEAMAAALREQGHQTIIKAEKI